MNCLARNIQIQGRVFVGVSNLGNECISISVVVDGEVGSGGSSLLDWYHQLLGEIQYYNFSCASGPGGARFFFFDIL